MTVLYGSATADGTLTTACVMAATSGGTETSAATAPPSGTGRFYAEVWSQGNAALPAIDVFTTLPTPQGNGWTYTPGAGTFAAGNWSASCTFSTTVVPTVGSQFIIRFYKYSGGSYTAIGSIVATWVSSTKQTYTFAATSMSAVTFGSSDRLYTDVFFYDSGGPGGDNPTVYQSTTSTAGVTNDMQVTTSTFTATHFRLSDGYGGVFS